eukprot:15146473-Alexandrium_andersonii.AAC.1
MKQKIKAKTRDDPFDGQQIQKTKRVVAQSGRKRAYITGLFDEGGKYTLIAEVTEKAHPFYVQIICGLKRYIDNNRCSKDEAKRRCCIRVLWSCRLAVAGLGMLVFDFGAMV